MNKLAVTGLDIVFADINGVDQFERALYKGAAITPRAFDERDVSVLLSDFIDRLLLQSSRKKQDTVIIVVCADNAIELKQAADVKAVLYVANIAEALTVAQEQGDNITTAVVGLNIEKKVSSEVQQASISFAKDFTAYQRNEVVCGLLLNSYKSIEHGDYYGVIDAFSSCDIDENCFSEVLEKSGLQASDIELVELSAAEDNAIASHEQTAIINAYQSASPLSIAISSVKSVTGHCSNANALLSLLKTVICLQQRYIPAISQWNEPENDKWYNSPFYFPVDSRPWFTLKNNNKRFAAIGIIEGKSHCHLIVSDSQHDIERSNGYLAHSDLVLIPVAASHKNMLTEITKLEEMLGKANSVREVAESFFQQFDASKKQPITVFLAESLEELKKEVELGKSGVALAIENNSEWKTPKGSYFTCKPVIAENNVAFLYPGIGAAYIGLGKDLFHLFPQVFHPASELADDFGESVKDKTLNPRSISRLGFKEIKAMDSKLRNQLSEIAECGVAYACVFTFIFEKVFQLKSDFATGYSMGEVSMYAALGCWKDPGQMSARLASSDTFNHRLSGELQALRAHWGLPEVKSGTIDKLWETYTLKATAEQVQEACEDEDRVYCTIINTPDSLVIGGYPEACQRVIKRIGVRAMALDMPNAIHSPPAFKEYENMENLYTMDVADRIDTKLYSSSCYLPVPQRTKAIANSIAKCLCDPVDFPRLIETMHEKGAEIFIEMGPGRSLSSWVEKILKHDQEHVSMPVDAKGTSDELTLMRSLAKLVSHGVNVNINSLYQGSMLFTNDK